MLGWRVYERVGTQPRVCWTTARSAGHSWLCRWPHRSVGGRQLVALLIGHVEPPQKLTLWPRDSEPPAGFPGQVRSGQVYYSAEV